MFIKLVFAVLAAGLLVWLARAQWQAAARAPVAITALAKRRV